MKFLSEIFLALQLSKLITYPNYTVSRNYGFDERSAMAHRKTAVEIVEVNVVHGLVDHNCLDVPRQTRVNVGAYDFLSNLTQISDVWVRC